MAVRRNEATLGSNRLRAASRRSTESEPITSLGDAGRRPAELTGGHAGQCDELSPAEGGPGRREFLADRAVVFLGVQGAVLADCVVQEQVEHGSGRLA